VADDNSIHGMGWPECGTITLTKDTPVDLQVNYYENDGLAGLRLYWRLPGDDDSDPTIVPANVLSHKTNGGKESRSGLYGEYFRQVRLIFLFSSLSFDCFFYIDLLPCFTFVFIFFFFIVRGEKVQK